MTIKIFEFTDDKGDLLPYYMPERAHDNDAGADVRTPYHITISPGETYRVDLNFGIDVPNGMMALVMPKSGLCARGIFSQIPPIDSGYNGIIGCYLFNSSKNVVEFNAGDKIGQLVFINISDPTFSPDYDKFERGDGKQGSTGK